MRLSRIEAWLLASCVTLDAALIAAGFWWLRLGFVASCDLAMIANLSVAVFLMAGAAWYMGHPGAHRERMPRWMRLIDRMVERDD